MGNRNIYYSYIGYLVAPGMLLCRAHESRPPEISPISKAGFTPRAASIDASVKFNARRRSGDRVGDRETSRRQAWFVNRETIYRIITATIIILERYFWRTSYL